MPKEGATFLQRFFSVCSARPPNVTPRRAADLHHFLLSPSRTNPAAGPILAVRDHHCRERRAVPGLRWARAAERVGP